MEFETRAIHEGQDPDPATGRRHRPDLPDLTYVQDASGEHKGYDYSRTANPDSPRARDVPRLSWRAPSTAFAFSSGMGATTTVMQPRLAGGSGSWPVNDVYGGTLPALLEGVRAEGLRVRVCAARRVVEAIDAQTRLVWVETPTNPLLNIVDIREVAEAAHAVGAVVLRRQHLRNPVPPAAARSSGPTSSSTRPRSTSAATRI
jgi:cystathionine beta-lyase/cystathionine gamma-synthase